MNQTAHQRGYADPIRIGVVLGLLLFAVILVAGRGLGASGAFAAGNAYVAERIPRGARGLFSEWLVIELIGVALGAWWSARRAGRVHLTVDRPHGGTAGNRMVRAALGGVLMGGGARLAHGCTSGLGLTGGALLSTGAWLFIPAAFGTAFVVAWLLRRSVAAVVS